MRRRLAAILLALAASLRAQPVRLDPSNPHYFLFAGRTVALITSGEHYGAVLNGDFNYHRYLDTLAADKLNYTRLFGGAYVEVPGKSFGILRNTLAPGPHSFIAPWLRAADGRFDLDRWNSQYSERFRDFLAEASRRGIVVEVTFFSSEYDEAQWAVSPFNAANNVNRTSAIDWKLLHTLNNGNIRNFQEKYVRKLVREANSFDNVIFELQNEPWSDRPMFVNVINPYLAPPSRDKFPNSREVADELSLAWQKTVAGWVTSEEESLPKRHLIAQNYCNFGLPVRELEPAVSIVNFHYAYPEAATANYGLAEAISYDETGFLGREDQTYLRQAWNFMLSGGGVFDNLDYSFSPGHEDGSDTEPNGPGGGSPALRHELRILSEFLNTSSLPRLRLDRESVRHATGVTPRVLSDPGREYKIYLDGRGPTALDLLLPPGNYIANWIDPASGRIPKHENFSTGANSPATLKSPPFESGLALHIARVQSR